MLCHRIVDRIVNYGMGVVVKQHSDDDDDDDDDPIMYLLDDLV